MRRARTPTTMLMPRTVLLGTTTPPPDRETDIRRMPSIPAGDPFVGDGCLLARARGGRQAGPSWDQASETIPAGADAVATGPRRQPLRRTCTSSTPIAAMARARAWAAESWAARLLSAHTDTRR